MLLVFILLVLQIYYENDMQCVIYCFSQLVVVTCLQHAVLFVNDMRKFWFNTIFLRALYDVRQAHINVQCCMIHFKLARRLNQEYILGFLLPVIY